MDLIVRNLSLSYAQPEGGTITVIDIDSLAVPAGTKFCITGPSGAGKTSLLYTLAGIEKPDSGTISWGEQELTALKEGECDAWRRENIGFIFQDFHLFPGMSVLQNVLLPASFGGNWTKTTLKRRASELLDTMKAPSLKRSIESLSRGERQRVAIARALLNQPKIIIADEPTASLDAATGDAIIALLLQLAEERHCSVIIVSHDPQLLQRVEKVHHLINGKLTD